MIALQIKSTKQFMSALLASEAFDGFLLESADLLTAYSYTIDGHINKEFYGDEEDIPYELAQWKSLRSICYELIKGKHTPLGFKFVFCATPDKRAELLEGEAAKAVSNLVFIIRFKEGRISLTTGVALSDFLLDKSYEKVWDDYMKAFLTKSGIEFEEEK